MEYKIIRNPGHETQYLIVASPGMEFECLLTDGKMRVGEIAVRNGFKLDDLIISDGTHELNTGIGFASGRHSSGGGAVYTRLITKFVEVPAQPQ